MPCSPSLDRDGSRTCLLRGWVSPRSTPSGSGGPGSRRSDRIQPAEIAGLARHGGSCQPAIADRPARDAPGGQRREQRGAAAHDHARRHEGASSTRRQAAFRAMMASGALDRASRRTSVGMATTLTGCSVSRAPPPPTPWPRPGHRRRRRPAPTGAHSGRPRPKGNATITFTSPTRHATAAAASSRSGLDAYHRRRRTERDRRHQPGGRAHLRRHGARGWRDPGVAHVAKLRSTRPARRASPCNRRHHAPGTSPRPAPRVSGPHGAPL